MGAPSAKEAFDERQAVIDAMAPRPFGLGYARNENEYRRDNPDKLRYFDTRWSAELYRDCTQADIDRLMKIEGEYYRLRHFIAEGLMAIPDIKELTEEEFVDELVRLNDKIQVVAD